MAELMCAGSYGAEGDGENRPGGRDGQAEGDEE